MSSQNTINNYFGFSTIIYLPLPANYALKKLVGEGIKIIEILYEIPQICGWKEIIEIKNSYNLVLSVHAPFYDINLCSLSEEIRKLSLKRIKNCLYFSYKIEAQSVVIHPGHYPNFDNKIKTKAKKKYFKSLKEILYHSNGIPITLENESKAPAHKSLCFPLLEDMHEITKEFGIKITFDVGHAYITHKESFFKFLRNYKNLIENVHIHDNNGESDLHLIPLEGKINFKKVFDLIGNKKYIIEIGNKGSIYSYSSEELIRKSLDSIEKIWKK